MKVATRFPLIEMSGSHYEMGRQYGTQCRELIRDLQARFDRLILRGENVGAARAVARDAVPYVQDAAPELIEEVQGIADASGLEFDAVFRMNCSVEVFAWQGCIGEEAVSTVPAPPDGCSSFALRAREGTLVAWNMDWWTVWQPYIVLLHGRPNDGPRFFAFAFVGCVGRPGMSEQVAVAANYLPYRGGMAPGRANEWEGAGVPYGFLSRIMLKQRSTEDAIAVAAGVKRMAGLNYTIGDVAGDIRCIETTPLDRAEFRPEHLAAPGTGSDAPCDFLTHANSYLTRKFNGIPEDKLRESDPRTAHAREQLRAAARPLDRHSLMAAMASHFPDDPTGICVHQQLQDKPGISLLSFIANVGNGRMWAAMGSPCEHEYLEYEL